eukprot:CAMPEP_0113451066 /NCGR_PEP_ID=MMETSP0014_2-20120614/6150_1 /TAXON_ID=2857 /ORGANISM="Nitzschia sp." /LENGTH=1504 /DNA_ID=CAMNT_0000342417 /DNA_START=487 /DNA_END=5002 /DNA_ORIENTATION=- /assembly_acc=CAM_ASM_000159
MTTTTTTTTGRGGKNDDEIIQGDQRHGSDEHAEDNVPGSSGDDSIVKKEPPGAATAAAASASATRRSTTMTTRMSSMMSMSTSSRMIDMSGAISNSSSSSSSRGGSDNSSDTGSDGSSSGSREKRPLQPLELEDQKKKKKKKKDNTPSSIMVGYTIEDGLKSSSSGSVGSGQGQEMVLVDSSGLKRRRRRRLMLFVLLGLVFLLLVVVAPSVASQNNNKKQSSTSAAATATATGSTNGIDTDAKGDGNDDDDDETFEPYSVSSSSSSSFQSKYRQLPFSNLDPVTDLGLVAQGFQRPQQFMPSKRLDPLLLRRSTAGDEQQKTPPLPTNTWYQNLLGLKTDEQPTPSHKVYTVPYIIDVMMTSQSQTTVEEGLRVHPTRLTADTTQVAVTVDEPYALHIGLGRRRPSSSSSSSSSTSAGTTGSTTTSSTTSNTKNNDYQVVATSELSLTMQWNGRQQQQQQTQQNNTTKPTMTTTLTRGMPYVTMIYDVDENGSDIVEQQEQLEVLLPTMFIGRPLVEPPIIDQVPVMTTPAEGNLCAPSTTSSSSSNGSSGVVMVESEFEFAIQNGNKPQRWMVFVSRPVELSCRVITSEEAGGGDETTTFQLKPQPSVREEQDEHEDMTASYTSTSPSSPQLVVRTALIVDDVTASLNGSGGSTGTNIEASSTTTSTTSSTFEDGYKSLLRSGANIYPGVNPTVDFAFNNNQEDNVGGAEGTGGNEQSQATPTRSRITFDWDPQYMNTQTDYQGEVEKNMIMFALPHHQDILRTGSGQPQQLLLSNMCTLSLLGKACLVQSPVLSLLPPEEQDGDEGTSTSSTTAVSVSRWEMYEDLPPVQLRAQRPPQPRLVPVLAEALMDDINYQIPTNFQIGAGDTYFSSKTIARLARILLINEELQEICDDTDVNVNQEYADVCTQIVLPSEEQSRSALDQLRRVMTVWIDDNQQAPFVYDTTWGGTVSCGCLYSGGVCTNAPSSTASEDLNCPSFTDNGLNFGNGVYNDHHFHYGYFVYASAVLSHFDSQWGIENFENVLLLIRDYANPSHNDQSYPVFRNKDWYKGHSWAAGLVDPVFVNINNQESSSEAIASYEAVALYGQVMSKNFQSLGGGAAVAGNESDVANNIHRIGLVLTATELRSTQKYWQIYDDGGDDSTYPAQPYNAGVVGILWETMIQFTTWFGNSPYLIYGIQLLPITPISEQRDSPKWAEAIYARLSQSCDNRCVSEGWSVQIFALLAILGKIDEAIELTKSLNPSVYVGPGGNGHSKSNTIWYIATRPQLPSDTSSSPSIEEQDDVPDFPVFEFTEITCSQPESSVCTETVLDSLAGDYSCRSRIEWLINNESMSETASCSTVAGEFSQCRACNPSSSSSGGGSDLDDVADEGNGLAQGDEEVRTQEPSFESSSGSNESDIDDNDAAELTCFQPVRCTSMVLNRMAGGFTCKDRIEYLIDDKVSPKRRHVNKYHLSNSQTNVAHVPHRRRRLRRQGQDLPGQDQEDDENGNYYEDLLDLNLKM